MTEQEADELVALILECRATARRAVVHQDTAALEQLCRDEDDDAWRAVLQWIYGKGNA